MRILPREHGATVIWLASLVLALASLTATLSPVRLAGFVAAAVLALVLLGRFTSGSVAVMRMERHAVLLPLLSGLLTLVVPVGELVMLGRSSPPILAAWLLFATYTMAGVVLTRVGVRAILRRRTPAMARGVLLVAAVVAAEVVAVHWLGWLDVASVAILVPLVVYWRGNVRLSRSEETPRTRVVRRVGFAQSGNMIAVAAILAVVLRL
jgi:hypothetical protein